MSFTNQASQNDNKDGDKKIVNVKSQIFDISKTSFGNSPAKFNDTNSIAKNSSKKMIDTNRKNYDSQEFSFQNDPKNNCNNLDLSNQAKNKTKDVFSIPFKSERLECLKQIEDNDRPFIKISLGDIDSQTPSKLNTEMVSPKTDDETKKSRRKNFVPSTVMENMNYLEIFRNINNKVKIENSTHGKKEDIKQMFSDYDTRKKSLEHKFSFIDKLSQTIRSDVIRKKIAYKMKIRISQEDDEKFEKDLEDKFKKKNVQTKKIIENMSQNINSICNKKSLWNVPLNKNNELKGSAKDQKHTTKTPEKEQPIDFCDNISVIKQKGDDNTSKNFSSNLFEQPNNNLIQNYFQKEDAKNFEPQNLRNDNFNKIQHNSDNNFIEKLGVNKKPLEVHNNMKETLRYNLNKKQDGSKNNFKKDFMKNHNFNLSHNNSKDKLNGFVTGATNKMLNFDESTTKNISNKNNTERNFFHKKSNSLHTEKPNFIINQPQNEKITKSLPKDHKINSLNEKNNFTHRESNSIDSYTNNTPSKFIKANGTNSSFFDTKNSYYTGSNLTNHHYSLNKRLRSNKRSTVTSSKEIQFLLTRDSVMKKFYNNRNEFMVHCAASAKKSLFNRTANTYRDNNIQDLVVCEEKIGGGVFLNKTSRQISFSSLPGIKGFGITSTNFSPKKKTKLKIDT